MPKPRNEAPSDKSASSGQSGKGNWTNPVTFIDGYLNDQDKKWLEDNYKDSASLIADLLAELGEYGGLTGKPDKQSGKYLVILFGGADEAHCTGFALTARATDPFDAYYALAYKHLLKFERKWGGAGGQAASRWD